MLQLIQDVLETNDHKRCPVTDRWLPAIPLSHRPEWQKRIRDAWAVLRGRAEAVQWPHQRTWTSAKELFAVLKDDHQ